MTQLLQQFLNTMPRLDWVAALDILLVAVLVYQLLLLIRGTRAAPMLLGVMVLGMIFYVAHLTGLRTLDWMVGTMLPYGIFALMVIFQVEIRQVLSRLGRGLVISSQSNSRGAGTDVFDEIVLACTQMSQTQTGALIVIERDIGLRTYIESGVQLDAHLSFDLLLTLFRPSAPLHDGAVILQRDRIAAAACFLPLSMNSQLSLQMGTRHRAGIGITEETDAISVIVSEETGGISLAHGGNVERELTPEILRSRLCELMLNRRRRATLAGPMPGYVRRVESARADGGERDKEM